VLPKEGVFGSSIDNELRGLEGGKLIWRASWIYASVGETLYHNSLILPWSEIPSMPLGRKGGRSLASNVSSRSMLTPVNSVLDSRINRSYPTSEKVS
jgi:hypothetical protein